MDYSVSNVRIISYPQGQKQTLTLHWAQIDSMWIKELNVKMKTSKILVENIRIFYDLWVEKDLLRYKTPPTLKARTDKLGYIKNV